MKRIGMIVAVEMKSVLDKYGSQIEKTEEVAGFKIYTVKIHGYELIVLHSGVGEIAASAAAQLLISVYHVEFILNFGVVGGLTPEMAKAKACIVERIVHYDFDTSEYDGARVGQYDNYPDEYIYTTKSIVEKVHKAYPDLKVVTCASGDKFVGKAEDKIALHNRFGADICEMESAGVVLTCNRNNIPCLLIKIVSDSIQGGFEEFNQTKDMVSAICLDIVESLIKEI